MGSDPSLEPRLVAHIGSSSAGGLLSASAEYRVHCGATLSSSGEILFVSEIFCHACYLEGCDRGSQRNECQDALRFAQMHGHTDRTWFFHNKAAFRGFVARL
jgi:hypothetical protein